MDNIATMDFTCVTCAAKGHEFRASNKSDVKRHVAVAHGEGAYSTLRCGRCERKFYDFPHFEEHAKWPPMCNTTHFIMNREPLSEEVIAAFDHIVSESMQPIYGDAGPLSPSILLFPKEEEIHNDVLLIQTAPQQRNGNLAIEIGGTDDRSNESILRVPSTPASTRSLQITPARKSIAQSKYFPSAFSMASKPEHLHTRPSSHVKQPGVNSQPNVAISDSMMSPNATSNTIPMGTELNDFCRAILRRRRVKGYIQCKLCKNKLKVFTAGKCLRTDNALDHANLHLGILFISCKFCDFKTESKARARLHIATTHRLSGLSNCEDSSLGHVDAIKKMFLDCFDHEDTIVVASKTTTRKQMLRSATGSRASAIAQTRVAAFSAKSANRSKCAKTNRKRNATGRFIQERGRVGISNHDKSALAAVRLSAALQLIKRFADRNNSCEISCRVCNSRISVGTVLNRFNPRSYHWHSKTVIYHAMSHSGRRCYHCQLCGFVSSRKEITSRHVKKSHGVGIVTQNLILDNSDQFHDELMEWLSKCFDHSLKPVGPFPKIGSTGNDQNIDVNTAADPPLIGPLRKSVAASVSATRGPPLKKMGPKHRPPDHKDVPKATTELFKCKHCGYVTKFAMLIKGHVDSNMCQGAAN